MKPSDRVNRIQDQQPAGATVLEVQWDNILIEYDEGGQGWWPISCLTLIDDTDWPTFKTAIFSNAALGQIILRAQGVVPLAAFSLAASFYKAEAGDIADFAACWRAILSAVPIERSILDSLQQTAHDCNLPQAFIDSLQPQNNV